MFATFLLQELICHSGPGDLLLLCLLQRERQHRYRNHFFHITFHTQMFCNVLIYCGNSKISTKPPSMQISHCSGSSSIQSRGEAENETQSQLWPQPLMVMGPWQSSLPLPLWSNPALSAHYRHHLHHPVHYHRCVALPSPPVQHYRHPNYLESWKVVSVTALEGGLSIPIMPYRPSLWTCSVSVHIVEFFFFFFMGFISLSTQEFNDVAVHCSPAYIVDGAPLIPQSTIHYVARQH